MIGSILTQRHDGVDVIAQRFRKAVLWPSRPTHRGETHAQVAYPEQLR
jgi:hypothetical protein